MITPPSARRLYDIRRIAIVVQLATVLTAASSQNLQSVDPCGYPDTSTAAFQIAASSNWGYGYDTLLYDIGEWKKSPFVTVDSVGASVQNRTLFVLTIQDTTADTLHLRRRVWIHARTHPNEVQGTWVTNEMIKILLSDSLFADTLRRRYVFEIMPMYNPDGVELGKSRQNANNIDLESNWNAASPQPEVLVLRAQFERMMALPNPMTVMLNMHSSISCKRYFVYHAAGGTSLLFSLLEQRYINDIRSHFPGGIEPYTYFVSWTSAPATQYPESWCWFNHQEKIMAMTYEDMNCASAGKFDSTANALLRGINDYLQDTTTITSVFAHNLPPDNFKLGQNFPNPFNPSTTIAFSVPAAESEGVITLRVFDILGREVATLVNGMVEPGRHTVLFKAQGLPSGIYLYRLTGRAITVSKKMLLLR
ncbi:MAG: M14 family zinc carboxypeptidase [Bacteroidota bacterium]